MLKETTVHTHHNIERKRIAMTLKSLVNPKTASILLFVFRHFYFPNGSLLLPVCPTFFFFFFREKQLPIIRSLTLPSVRPSHSFLSLIVAGMHAVQQRRAKGGERAPLFGKVVRRMDAFLSVWEKRRIAAAVSRAVDRGREGDWGLLWAPTDVEGLPGWVGGQAGALLWRWACVQRVGFANLTAILNTHV